MKVLHVSYADKGGGGAIGAYRLHTSMLAQNVDSQLLVIIKRTLDPTVLRAPAWIRIINKISRKLSAYILKLQKPADFLHRSLNIFPTGIWKCINSIDADIVHLHWINENTVGIPDFKFIRKPIIWKLPDMWAFSGCEHYPTSSRRPYEGYSKINRTIGAKGLDLDRLVWLQKRKHWSNLHFTIVSPSRWLAECARSSYLFKRYPVHNIPNPINLHIYKPAADIIKVRQYLNLPYDKKLIMYTSLHDPRKGYSFLEKCLCRLSKSITPADYRIVIMGYKVPYDSLNGIEIINLGYFHEELDIAMAYSAVNVCAVPSYADNLPNTIKESMACGTPCVAFNTGGIPEMITHKVNGYLVPVNDIDEFCNGLKWILTGNYQDISTAAREAACKCHDPEVIIKKYVALYNDVIANRSCPKTFMPAEEHN